MMMSEIFSAASEPFWNAELEYRRERAQRYLRPGGAGGRKRRWIPRRPTLKLPQSRPRPVAVA